MKRVREERISNSKIRCRFFDIPTINNFIASCMLWYIRKMAQSVSNISLQTQFLIETEIL
jgi:hypothetical protein